MKRYLKFAASFWVSAFLVAGSMVPGTDYDDSKGEEEGR